MAQNYFSILTDIGQAKTENAIALGQTVPLTHFALGDGNGDKINPAPEMTELVNEVFRAGLNTLDIDEETGMIVATVVLPPETGGFTVREVGIFDADGDLFAVGSFPDTYKPELVEGAAGELRVRMLMSISNAAAVELIVDPTVILATRNHVAKSIQDHNNSHEAHGGHALRTDNPHNVTAEQIGLDRALGVGGVRNAILSCPMSDNGLPNFVQTDGDGDIVVQASVDAPLLLSFSNGYDKIGPIENIESIETPTTIPAESLTPGTTNYVYAERGPDGITLSVTTDKPVYKSSPLAESLELFAPAEDYVWPGVGTISASSEYTGTSNNEAWRAFMQKWEGGDDDWSAAGTSGWLRVVFDHNRMLAGYAIVGTPRVYLSRKEPRTWDFLIGQGDNPDTVADFQENQTGWVAGERRDFIFPSPVLAKSIEINVSQCNNSENLTIGELIPIFAEEWRFNPATYSPTSGQERVYVGEIDVESNSSVVDCFGYHPGVFVTMDANSGLDITPNSRYVEKHPFGAPAPASVLAKVFWNGKWANSGFYQEKTAGRLTHATWIDTEGIIIQTGSSSLCAYARFSGGGHGVEDSVLLSAPCQILVRRCF